MWGPEFTGIGNYISEVATRLFTNMPKTKFIVLLNEQNFSSLELPTNVTKVLCTIPIYSFQEQTKFVTQLNKIDADLYWFPHFNVPLRFKKPFISTIHDLTQLKYQGNKMSKPWHRFAYQKTLQHALDNSRANIAVSYTTLLDIQQFFPKTDLEKVRVIYNGVDYQKFDINQIDYKKVTAFQRQFGNEYFLITGVWREHKNHVRAVAAFNKYCEQGGEWNLVITGKDNPHYPEIREAITDSPYRKRIFTPGFIEQDDMPVLLRSARALLFPSLAEGFGLPAIEAMSTATPVLASNVSSLPEICGQAALYFHPLNIDQMTQQMLTLSENDRLQQKLVFQSKFELRRFDWDKSAKEHQKIFENALQS